MNKLLAFALAGFVALLTGCGYTTTELYPTQYTTVTVPNFENRSNDRNVEFTLREALIKEIEQRTPYKTVSGTGLSDTQLTGTIVRVNRRLISRDATAGLSQEIEVTVVVDFEWRDLRTGEVVRGFRGLSSAGQFVPNRAVGEFDDDGVRLAVSRLASDIVARMREDGW
ncbi:MAG: LPS assembly lipoprotein LptE [Planctomycetota bacterium]